jgi:hypothetical protein
MSGLNIVFDGVEEAGFGLLPNGEYTVIVDSAVIKETKDGQGEFINMKLKVTEGNHSGRFLFTMFNIKNKNPEAVKIGMGSLKTFCKVSGRGDKPLTDVNDLVGHIAVAVVKTKTDDYGEKNAVSYFKARSKASEVKKPADGLPF